MTDIPEEKNDKAIIYEYLKGDQRALEFLVKKYIKPIYSFVYRNVGDVEAAEDITQEVFIRVWKNIRRFDLNKDFKPWIFQIAKNASIDYLRKRKTIPFSRFENSQGQNMLTETLIQKSPELIETLNTKTEFEKTISGLSEKDKNLIQLRHSQGMSFKEIAQKMNSSINTIKSRYRRTIKNMQKKATK
ncbi:MAG TPA: sigma-70 family RNA polymerase sigma factor [Candidatus Staskawiczbacteria bacterium]|nr:sigma-70 family RNA polymerase sigma factor [Candidatus Staskawiczbacteria bacterium]